ncbi:MAG: hypothetical protein IKY57_08080 [Alistipes sp.]|nr:hypothetical protein [Alistipes sp.]
MEWHEILAWGIVIVAVVAAAVWLIRRIVCPESRCASCDKHCIARKMESGK